MPGLSFLNETVSIKAGKAHTLEKTGNKEGTAMSVHSHRYMHLAVCLLRKSLSSAQAIYCADPFVIVIATKFKCVHKI